MMGLKWIWRMQTYAFLLACLGITTCGFTTSDHFATVAQVYVTTSQLPVMDGNILWLKADLGAYTATGQVAADRQPVQEWRDQSADALHHASAVAPAQQPVFIAHALLGKPALRFNGTTSLLTIPDQVTVGTAFVVANAQDGATFQSSTGILATDQHTLIAGRANTSDIVSDVAGELRVNGFSGELEQTWQPSRISSAAGPMGRIGRTGASIAHRIAGIVTLGGLVTPDAFQRRAVWWATKLYADGVTSRVQSHTNDPRVVALGSSRSDLADQAQVLIGFFDLHSPPTSTIAIQLQQVDHLPFMGSSSYADMTIERIPATGAAPVASLPVVQVEQLRIKDGTLDLTLTNVAVNEAYRVTVRAANQARLYVPLAQS